MLYISSSNGVATVSSHVPDTITSWVATAFAIHNQDGLGVTPHEAKVAMTTTSCIEYCRYLLTSLCDLAEGIPAVLCVSESPIFCNQRRAIGT